MELVADGARFRFSCDDGRPLLDEGLRLGLDLSFGCRMGSCGMCAARLVRGRVEHVSQVFLSKEQLEEGFVLLCQARPGSDVVLETCSGEEIAAL